MSKDDKKKDETKPEAKPAGFTPAAAGESKPPRQTTAPLCPNCSTAEAPQHTRAASSPKIGSAFFTYYRCPRPGCPYSIKLPRPSIASQVARARDAETDHSAR